jgi:nicotinate-nucleotide pyrophosphorylase (carboxylating)
VNDDLRALVERALAEDRVDNDITTLATVPEGTRGRAVLIAKQDAIVAGLDVFAACFEGLNVMLCASATGGEEITAGSVIARVTGDLRRILSVERTALNFVQRLSGIATLTREFVRLAPGVEVRDTRKTTPGLRDIEKAAVRAGGGTSHRRDLSSAILIKDNHIIAAGSIEQAIKAAQATGAHVEVECDTLEQVRAAVDAGADEVLLDNMDLATLSEAVALTEGRVKTEASGGVTLDTIGAIARSGVDAISVGALTHSAPAVDLSLEVEVLA